MSTPAVSYNNHRFSPDIITHAVWLYYRFSLSLRLVEEMLLERGIVASCNIWGYRSRLSPGVRRDDEVCGRAAPPQGTSLQGAKATKQSISAHGVLDCFDLGSSSYGGQSLRLR
jgi:hypothetical protein